MKTKVKIKIDFVILLNILFLCSLIFLSCKNEGSTSKYDDPKVLDELHENTVKKIRYEISIICYKYGISNEIFIEEVVKIKSRHTPYEFLKDYHENKDNPEIILQYFSDNKEKKTNQIFDLGKQYNIDKSIIAKIIYDYEIWTAAANCEN